MKKKSNIVSKERFREAKDKLITLYDDEPISKAIAKAYIYEPCSIGISQDLMNHEIRKQKLFDGYADRRDEFAEKINMAVNEVSEVFRSLLGVSSEINQ